MNKATAFRQGCRVKILTNNDFHGEFGVVRGPVTDVELAYEEHTYEVTVITPGPRLGTRLFLKRRSLKVDDHLTRGQRATFRWVRRNPGTTAIVVAGVVDGVSSVHWALNHLEALQRRGLIACTSKPVGLNSYASIWSAICDICRRPGGYTKDDGADWCDECYARYGEVLIL